jgi:hypothetical protein
VTDKSSFGFLNLYRQLFHYTRCRPRSLLNNLPFKKLHVEEEEAAAEAVEKAVEVSVLSRESKRAKENQGQRKAERSISAPQRMQLLLGKTLETRLYVGSALNQSSIGQCPTAIIGHAMCVR